ncbi:unnamed protein product [Symbiodinium natans]|uniref:PPIase cyclophilin-type domain-containing protein n=1 Tax=Symbiodinium natans TaxID=878477 RepID=A0A812UP33_9DINO|nr:unnamed protein product [Symbiodinium natans]
MATDRRYEVKMSVPDGAMPGMLLDVPVRGGSEKVRIRVPDGCGAGSVLVLSQAEGSSEWDLNIEATSSAQDMGPGDDGVRSPPGNQLPQEESPRPVMSEQPVAYTVRLDTTVGVIDIIVRPDWAPHGTRRFLELATSGDLSNLAFYRAIKGCISQFGLPPKRPWPPIPDDPPTGVPFLLGAVSFAAIGPNARKSTLFICTGDMSHCLGDKSWETPIGAVAEASLDVLDYIETIYGDIVEFGGQGPDTSRINSEGNIYLQTNFPKLTYIKSATVLDDGADVQTGNEDDPSSASRAAKEAEGVARANASTAQQASQQAQQAAAKDSMEELREAARRARQAAHAAVAAAEAAEAAQAAVEGRRAPAANHFNATPQMHMAVPAMAPAMAMPQQQMVPAMVPSPCPGQQRMLSGMGQPMANVANPTVQALQLAQPAMQQTPMRPLLPAHGQVMGPPFMGLSGCRPLAPQVAQGAFPVMSNGSCGVPQAVRPQMLPQARPCQPGPPMDLT